MACRTNFQKKFEKPLDKPLGLWYNEYIKDKDSLKNQKGIDTMEKMTYAKALEIVLNGGEMTTEVTEKLTALKASVEKKNTTERKPTATQLENEKLKLAILETMESGKGYTIADLMKCVPALDGLANQRVSAIVRQMKDAGTVTREEIKRKAYFTKVEG